MKCPVCDGTKTDVYKAGVTSVYSPKPYSISHCQTCNHYFTDPAPSPKELDDIYTNKYSYDAHSLIEGEKRMRARNYARYIAGLKGVSTVLEVGCMHGLLLTELEKLGIKAAGVELDPEAVKYCQVQGLNVTQGSIEEHLKKVSSKYDAVIMSHVLEHIADPTTQLSSLYKRIAAKGKLIIIVPNSMAPTRKLFGRYWGYWQVPVHINHFNSTSIKRLMTKTGFKVNDITFVGGDSLFFLSSLANRLGSQNETKNLSGAKKLLVRICTVVLRPWHKLGKEDMLVVATRKSA